VVARLPAQSIAEVARELREREEYVTMGRFAGRLTDEALLAVFAVVDDEALLRVAFVIEDEERLDHVFGLLPAPRRAGLVRTAAAVDLWPEALDLLSRLSERRCGELAEAAATQEAVLHLIVRAAQEHDLWPALLRAARAMGDESRRRLGERMVGPVSELTPTQREHSQSWRGTRECSTGSVRCARCWTRDDGGLLAAAAHPPSSSAWASSRGPARSYELRHTEHTLLEIDETTSRQSAW
jgi:hypothetical protein